MADLKWETPPPATRGPTAYTWGPVLDALRDRPGEWAVVATFEKRQQATNRAMALRNGRVTGTFPGEFEATARKVDGGTRVYARYVGVA